MSHSRPLPPYLERPRARGAFDLVPRVSPSAAASLSRSSQSSSSSGGLQGQGQYILGGGASVAITRVEQERLNELAIAQFKEKERLKKLKKLEEKIARYTHLNIDRGYTLDQDAASSSLSTIRQCQSQTYNEAVESYKMNQLEHESEEAQRQAEKLKEKVKKYSYLNTTPGRRLNSNASVHPNEESEHDAQNSSLLEHSEPLDNDRAMKEMRRRLQDSYNSSLKRSAQGNSEI